MRSEADIFEELKRLCTSPGYVHAVAWICFKDNILRYSDDGLTVKDMLRMFNSERLIRSELTVLFGLLIQQPIDYALPTPDVFQSFIDKTYGLLEELHRSMWPPITVEQMSSGSWDPFAEAGAMREPIFYSGESAYSFQYRDLAPRKYQNDYAWLLTNKGFRIATARDVIHAIGKFQNQHLSDTFHGLKSLPLDQRTILPGFAFTADDIAGFSGVPKQDVEKVLAAFTVSNLPNNSGFGAIHDFNVIHETPLLPAPNGAYLLFEQYSLVEALYDSPFYWMTADPIYAPEAMRHRGKFAENFAKERFERVFGTARV